MIARVFRYSCAQAKTRALKGKTPECRGLALPFEDAEPGGTFRYLSGTDYAAVLARFAGATPDRGALPGLL